MRPENAFRQCERVDFLTVCCRSIAFIDAYRDRFWGKTGAGLLRYYDEGHVNLLIITIIESADNENALVAPVIEAVHDVTRRRRNWTERGSAWLEAFDHLPPLMGILDDMRALDLFCETSLGKYLGMVLENKLAKHFEPPKIEPKVERPPVERKPVAERSIEEGLFLWQNKGPYKTSRITRLAHEKFGLSARDCGRAMNAARLYGDKLGLVRRLSRVALYELAAPSTPPQLREAIERRLQQGEKIGAPEILRCRAAQRQTTS